MKRSTWMVAVAAMALPVTAMAGDEPLYQPAPAWVIEAALPAATRGSPIVLADDQRRIEEGRVSTYTDRAVRIDNPQMLTAAGTLQSQWLPDKGDLIVHRVSIIRDGAEIDLLAGGARFDVLRRETQLERRVLDGSRTATMAVPGLRVGDILRLTHTVTLSDQALQREVETTALIPAEPFQAGFARLRISWPQGSDVRWQASGGIAVPEPSVADGFEALELALPVAERPDMPEDAPARYRMPPLLQAGTFADWAEVSRVMAPHYRTAGTIAPDSPLARAVAAIEAAHDAPLDRAIAALRLVQDEIAYLANGMAGGNYLPQAPAETWQNRYGDCKAKTVLLLAMLRAMGIEAEATLVSTYAGDALPGLLPAPGMFDHVIVRAVIGGTDYWMDGTISGASTAVASEVPAFHHALPLRVEGAGLMAMVQRPQSAFDVEARLTFDHRAGLDVPMLFTAEWRLTGPSVGPVRGTIGLATPEQTDEFVIAFATERLGDLALTAAALSFDPDSNSATVSASGLMTAPWRWTRGLVSRTLGTVAEGFAFRPDRARAAWRDIPVALLGPWSERWEVTVLLPDDAATGYRLEDKAAFDENIAGIRLDRETRLEEGRVVMVDSAAWPGGELAAAEIPAARSRWMGFGSTDLTLHGPGDAPRVFRYATGGDRARLAPIEAAYAATIERDPDDPTRYLGRAAFRAGTYDRAGALEDLTAALELEADADTYLWRSRLLADMDRMEEALADAEAAWDIAPSLAVAMQRATLLRFFDRQEEAIALLEDQTVTPEERLEVTPLISELEAEIGRKEDGLRRLEELLAQRPGDPAVLNARCWYQATWAYRIDDLADLCTRAVESADWSPPVLDSRAMAYFRLGRYDDALADLDAALLASPGLEDSLFMRGVVRRAMGDAGGAADIGEALARAPSLERYYALFGIAAR